MVIKWEGYGAHMKEQNVGNTEGNKQLRISQSRWYAPLGFLFLSIMYPTVTLPFMLISRNEK
jgi:hypothetical protein